MEKKAKDKVNKHVYSRYPSLKGIRPNIQRQKGKSNSTKETYLFIYKGSVNISGNKKMPLIVRVVCSENGKIKKLSTSR